MDSVSRTPDVSDIEQRFPDLRRASFRASVISALGFVMILASLGYSAFKLRELQATQTRLEGEIAQARIDLQGERDTVAGARQAVAASRAAINAFHSKKNSVTPTLGRCTSI
jgi:hypothetical protein